MPIKHCEKNGKPGFSWGNSSKCWTYDPKNESSKKKAKANCIKQAIAIEGLQKFKEEMATATNVTKDEVLQAQLSAIFDKAEDMEEDEPSEEVMMCPDCKEPMEEKEGEKDMMVCAKCGKESKK